MKNLILKHVYKIYENGTKAVNDFNLEIENNEFIVFVGPSGCGKSTTLRMIAGLEDITAGDLILDDKIANNLEPKDRDMAMVFQNYALYPHMSVYENMAFGLRLRHVPKDEIDRRVQKAAKILDIADQLEKKPKEMSGGQKQRVALGRAIVRNPRVFLLDEPLSNLDAKLRSSMRSEITRLHKVLGTTFIYVTHDQVEAMTMGTRIVVMSKGLIQQVDTPMNLYDYPKNTFVAGFIGSPQMNMFDATLNLNNDKIKLDIYNQFLILDRNTMPKLNLASINFNPKVKVGIRPEHLELTDKKDNSLEVEVMLVEALGHNTIIDGNIKNTDCRILASIPRNDNIKTGDVVYFKVSPDKIHLFSKENENTLLPRIPETLCFKAKINKGKLMVFDGEINLPPAIKENIKEFDGYIKMPLSAIKKGNSFNGKIINKEFINKENILSILIDGNYVFSKDIEDKDTYSFDIDLKQVDFVDKEGKIIFNHIQQNNYINGTLTPFTYKMNIPLNERKRPIKVGDQYEKNENTQYVCKRVKGFKYQLCECQFSIDFDIYSKIFSLLGKKFARHSLQYYFPIDKTHLNKDGIKGKITAILDYGDVSYFEIKILSSNEIVHVYKDDVHKIGDEVSIMVDINDIGVKDLNFGVVLI